MQISRSIISDWLKLVSHSGIENREEMLKRNLQRVSQPDSLSTDFLLVISVLGFDFLHIFCVFGAKKVDSHVATNSAKNLIIKMSVNRNEMKNLLGV